MVSHLQNVAAMKYCMTAVAKLFSTTINLCSFFHLSSLYTLTPNDIFKTKLNKTVNPVPAHIPKSSLNIPDGNFAIKACGAAQHVSIFS